MTGRRSEARRYAVLALYQWQLSGQPPAEIARHFFDDPAWMDAVAEGLVEDTGKGAPASPRPAPHRYDMQLFQQLLLGVPEQADAIDDALRPALERALTSIDPVERAILRVGTFELLYCPEVPVRVILNEAVELALIFGGEGGHRFVNSVLDRVARRLRSAELPAHRRRP
ncbi:MAG: transcription antitermination factor NusB [Chromatiaceae bacterium]|nr:MAG: transcription antitermination factor NusB [Chromatiaceae bacterium]